MFLPAVCWALTPSSCSPSDDVSVKFTDNCGSSCLQQLTPALMSLTQLIWATVNVAMSISLFCSTPMGIYNLLTCMLNSLFAVLDLLSHLKSYKAPPTTAGDTVWERCHLNNKLTSGEPVEPGLCFPQRPQCQPDIWGSVSNNRMWTTDICISVIHTILLSDLDPS